MLVGTGLAAAVGLTAGGVLGTFVGVLLAVDAWDAAGRFVRAHLAALNSRASVRGRYVRWLERRAGSTAAAVQRDATVLRMITRAVGGALAVGFAVLLAAGVAGLAGLAS